MRGQRHPSGALYGDRLTAWIGALVNPLLFAEFGMHFSHGPG